MRQKHSILLTMPPSQNILNLFMSPLGKGQGEWSGLCLVTRTFPGVHTSGPTAGLEFQSSPQGLNPGKVGLGPLH